MKEFEQQAKKAMTKTSKAVKGFLRDTRQDIKKAASAVRKEWKQIEPYNESIIRFPSEVIKALPAKHWCTGECGVGKQKKAKTWCKVCPVGVVGDTAMETKEYLLLRVKSKRIAKALEQQMTVDLPPLPADLKRANN
jgi:hypothetical protein